ncbi:vWA domain-containing protein [Flaviaesturariibacter amylovorans]|uniref:VWA domain-containing protein n=1 Tax=Flaviaesturariibacter amylovorans TaxID=1084520 RepID=A0ABP8GBG4_9BACT
MTLPFDIEFGRPEALYLLALVPLLALAWWSYRRWQRRRIAGLGDAALIARMMPGRSPHRAATRFFLGLLAFALGILALANPRRPAAGDPELRTGIDQVFALDVSNSMLASDVAPNRLQAAKDLLKSLIRQRRNDRVALVVFAGHAYAQLPLTYDHSAAELFIDAANPGQLPAQGTAVGEALDQCRELFGIENTGRYRTVLLLTDGETHDDKALESAKALTDRGVLINTVGIGSPGGTTLIDPKTKTLKKDESGNTVVSRLNQELLQNIASVGKGQYLLLSDRAAAQSALLAAVANVKSAPLVDKANLSYDPFYHWLLLPMLVLLVLQGLLPERKKVAA